MSIRNHVSECAEIVLLQHAFDGGKYPRDLMATSDDLFIGQSIGIFRFAHPRHRDFSPLKAEYVGCIFLGVYQIVLAASHKSEKIKKKLADIGRAHKVVQV